MLYFDIIDLANVAISSFLFGVGITMLCVSLVRKYRENN